MQTATNCTTKNPRPLVTVPTCCCREKVPEKILGQRYCQTCTPDKVGRLDCKAKQPQALEEPPTLPSGPLAGPLQDGVLEQSQQSPPLPDVKDNTKLQNNDGGVLQQPDQGTS